MLMFHYFVLKFTIQITRYIRQLMALVTTAVSGGINRNVINDKDRDTARELLCITESAVNALSLNCCQSRLTARDQKSGSSFMTMQARNVEDVENLSSESRSSTASEILKRSTHASAAFSVKSSLALSSEAARLVRVPVKVLREVPVPHDGIMFSGSMPTPHDRKAHVALQRKPDHLNADQSNSREPTRRKSERTIKQDNNKMHSDPRESAVDNPKISRKPPASKVETNCRIRQNEMSEGNSVHPLMAILDNGCLTQPIHTIVGDERMSSGDSRSTSMATSASPIEVLAEDKQTSRVSVSWRYL